MANATPDVSVELAKVLEWVREGADKAGAFAVEQAPLLAQEFVRYTLWSSVAQVVGGVVSLVLAFMLARKAYRTIRDEDANDDDKTSMAVGAIVVCIPLFVCGSIGVSRVDGALKATLAPRVLIVEKIGELVN